MDSEKRSEKVWVFESKGVYSIVRKIHPNQLPMIEKILKTKPQKAIITFQEWEEKTDAPSLTDS